jgi:hypothetical protein
VAWASGGAEDRGAVGAVGAVGAAVSAAETTTDRTSVDTRHWVPEYGCRVGSVERGTGVRVSPVQK